jgi:hypothetical protein
MTKITEQQFSKYVEVQMSGVTNMFDLKYVEYLTDLNKDEILEIMKNYTYYTHRYFNEVLPRKERFDFDSTTLSRRLIK